MSESGGRPHGCLGGLVDVQECPGGPPDVRELSGVPHGCPGVVERLCRISGSGHEALLDVQE